MGKFHYNALFENFGVKMVMEIIDPKRINWRGAQVFYRGHTQEWFEQQIAKSFIQGKPTYHGAARDYETGANLTYVWHDLGMAVGYAEYRLKEVSHPGLFPRLTRYPIVLAIKPEKYFDKLRRAEGGDEGICIEGEIDAGDISVLFSSEVNKVLNWEQSPKVQKYLTDLNKAITTRGLDHNQSIVKNPQLLGDLELICFNYPRTLNTEHEQKFADAIAYLKRKLEGN